MRSRWIRQGLTALLLLTLCLPLSMVLTFASFPFWRWIEERFGIEAFGHSGPAEWCFQLVYLLLLLLAGILWWRLSRSP